jgi:hypothetical protein
VEFFCTRRETKLIVLGTTQIDERISGVTGTGVTLLKEVGQASLLDLFSCFLRKGNDSAFIVSFNGS